jgi:Holliday junction resolvase
MRHRPRTDSNQTAIVQALRDCGCQVLSLAPMGAGVPDILIGTPKGLILVEIKDGSKPPSQRRLTRDEARFHLQWSEHVEVVESVGDALKLIGGRG